MSSPQILKMNPFTIDTNNKKPPTRDLSPNRGIPDRLPKTQKFKTHPISSPSGEEHNASLFFVGTATTILEWEGLRLMTDPNFLHAGDHVHLGPGVTGTRKTNPAVDLHDLPHIDAVLLSHFHADHFDQEVEASLRRDLPIIATPHAKECLTTKKGDDAFTAVHDLDFWDSTILNIGSQASGSSRKAQIKVTGMPGKHVPPGGVLEAANELLKAVPPTNGWMLELGYTPSDKPDAEFECGYRIYITGDTLLIPDVQKIPELYSHATNKPIDLMLIHLGGTTIPSPSVPLLMVTMDAKQGIELVKLVQPDLTLPIHYDDYDVFLSPLEDFKKEIEKAGLGERVVYLDRGDGFGFVVKGKEDVN